jgi:hypothetical protein
MKGRGRLSDSEVKIIKGSYIWSVDEIANAGIWHYRLRRRWMTTLLAVALLLVVGSRIALAIIAKENLSLELGFMLVLLLIPFFFFLMPVILRLMIRLNFSRRPENGKKVALTISAEAVIIDMEESIPVTYRWDALERVVKTPQGLLCYPAAAMQVWIPFKAFASATEVEQLTEFARQNLATYKEIR